MYGDSSQVKTVEKYWLRILALDWCQYIIIHLFVSCYTTVSSRANYLVSEVLTKFDNYNYQNVVPNA